MSGVAIINYLLRNNSVVVALVPASSITSGVTPQNTPMPAISITQISSTQRLINAMDAAEYFVTERVQVTAQAKTYAQQKAILSLARAALPLSRGTVNGFECESILPDSEGPDIYDADVILFMQSQDFIVKFSR